MVHLPSLTTRETPTISDIALAAISLIPRSKKSDDCEDDNTSSECEKPVSTDAMTIGLGVGIPVGIIILVLSFFLLKNYRKDKKESLEHDPDFDENGEATALPDFPQTKQVYTMEDPFHNRNSLRYPPQGFGKSNASISASTTTKEDPYIDNFILPYQHQTGSKISLDEYARHLGSNPGYAGTPRASNVGPRTRNSSVTNLSTLDIRGNGNGHTSPQKSNLKMEVSNANRDSTNGSSTLESKSPSKSVGGGKGEAQYTNIPNVSTASFNPEQFYNANDTLNESTTDISDESAMKALDASEKFGINYENESRYALNKGTDNVANHPDPDPALFDNANRLEDMHREEIESHNRAPSKASIKSASVPAPNLDLGVESPFEDKFSINRKPPTPASAKANITTAETSPMVADDSAHDASGLVDGDFTFSTTNEDIHDENGTAQNKGEEFVNDTKDQDAKDKTRSDTLATPGHSSGRKSPRISAFNLLKNDSDDEDDTTGDVNQKSLSPEQDEELKRMKSVYKVYFDRENSTKHPKRTGDLDESELAKQTTDHTFHHDPSQPLPHANTDEIEDAGYDYLKINKDLKGDTNYDKRMTTTSSIYTETPIFTREEQQQYYYQQQQMDPNFYGQHPLGSPNEQLSYQQPHPHYQQGQKPQQPLPPLRSLPTASDIRKSTIQTYTDFHPRPKNQVTSPTGKQAFNPIESDGVWSSPVTSPVNNSQPSFGNFTQSSSPNLGYVQPLNNGQQLAGPQTTPSATQLARSSVVMLNPVTEITKSRKFKPAGSLPSNSGPNQVTSPNSYHAPQFNQSVSSSDNDLIPGSRKSDVRRMMNTNF